MADIQQQPLMTRNQCSLAEHCNNLGGTNLDIYDFVSKSGKKTLFCMIAGKIHWASPNALAKIREGKAAQAAGDIAKAKVCFNMIQYVESKKPDAPEFDAQGRSNWVPSLLVRGNAPTESIQLTF